MTDPAQSAPSAEPDMLQKLFTLNGLPCATETAAYISIRKVLGAVASILVEREKSSIEAQLQDSYHTEIKLHNETLDKLKATETRAETAESALREAKKCLRDATDDLSEEWQRWIHEIDCVKKEGDEETPDTCSCDGYEIIAAVRALLTVAAQTPEEK